MTAPVLILVRAMTGGRLGSNAQRSELLRDPPINAKDRYALMRSPSSYRQRLKI
jgi:hypothetical protein